MALIRAISGSGGGGTPTLEYAGLITNLSGVNSYTFVADYDVIVIVTRIDGSGLKPTYNGVTYVYMSGNNSGKAALIQNVKANTTLTFEANIICSIYGYNYA